MIESRDLIDNKIRLAVISSTDEIYICVQYSYNKFGFT